MIAGVLVEWGERLFERSEAFSLVLSMPRGTAPQFVLRAARDFAKAELADHRYAMVLHDHQANPHVHLSVRAESRHGSRRRTHPARPGAHAARSRANATRSRDGA